MTRAAVSCALLLLAGCTSSFPDNPYLTSADCERAAKDLGAQIDAQAAEGWPDGIALEGGLPLLKLGQFASEPSWRDAADQFLERVASSLVDSRRVVRGDGDGALRLEAWLAHDVPVDDGRHEATNHLNVEIQGEGVGFRHATTWASDR